MSGCSQCGALVANMPRHVVWHQDLLKAMSDAVVTRDELDYLRDEILDGPDRRLPAGALRPQG